MESVNRRIILRYIDPAYREPLPNGFLDSDNLIEDYKNEIEKQNNRNKSSELSKTFQQHYNGGVNND